MNSECSGLQKMTPFTNQNVSWLLQDRAAQHGDKLFLAWEPHQGEPAQWTYAEFAQGVANWAVGLTNAGLSEGDYVVIHLDNCPEFLFAWHACVHLGCVPVTTNNRSVEDELCYYVEHSRAVAAITQSDYLPLFAQCGKQIRWVCSIDGSGQQAGPQDVNMLAIADLRDAVGELKVSEVSDQAVCSIQYTSGTTSRPKGVVWTHANALWGACVNAAHTKLTRDDRALVYFPLFHTNALSYSMLGSLWAGASIVLQKKFSASRFWPLSLKYKCTWAAMIPFITNALFETPDPSEAHHYRFWGGVFCDIPGVKERWGIKTIGWWGMTETITQGIVGSLDSTNTPLTVGRAATEYGLRIVDESGEDIDYGPTGRLLLKGTPGLSLFKEYLHNPEATKEAYDENGWFKTGDLVALNADGTISFSERENDTLKVGGENVSAAEIERVILSLPEVLEVAVVGRKHDYLDEVPVAFVVVAKGSHNIQKKVLGACREMLADYKVPSEVRLIDELPKILFGKIAKITLRRQLAEETESCPGISG